MGVRRAKNSAKDAAKAQKRDPFFDQLGPFHCSSCAAELILEKVLTATVDREDGTPTGYLNIEHHCACGPDMLMSRVLGTQFGIVALFGAPPALPYRAPFQWTAVAADDATVARWAWELEQVADWDEFMLFLSEPK